MVGGCAEGFKGVELSEGRALNVSVGTVEGEAFSYNAEDCKMVTGR